MTDLLLQNPRGDTGTLAIRRGDQVILQDSLKDVTTKSYQFSAPIQFQQDTSQPSSTTGPDDQTTEPPTTT